MINCVGEDKISDELKSARQDITKQLTCGKQTYTTDVNNYPVSQPIPKTTSLTQVCICFFTNLSKTAFF